MDASVLMRLGEIEDAAQKILAETADREAALRQEAEKRAADFDRAVDAKLQAELASMKSRLSKDMSLRERKLEQDAAARMTMLEQHFQKEKDARVEEILDAVLK